MMWKVNRRGLGRGGIVLELMCCREAWILVKIIGTLEKNYYTKIRLLLLILLKYWKTKLI
jgi:hypothetical protein